MSKFLFNLKYNKNIQNITKKTPKLFDLNIYK